jgi:hypothetical protein
VTRVYADQLAGPTVQVIAPTPFGDCALVDGSPCVVTWDSFGLFDGRPLSGTARPVDIGFTLPISPAERMVVAGDGWHYEME